MERHRRRIRQLESVLYVQLEDLMLCRWIAAIRLEHHVYRRESIAVFITNPRPELEHERRARNAQGVSWSTQRALRYARSSHQLVQHPSRADLALKRRAIDGLLEVSRAELVEHTDDLVATEVCCITHGRPP